MDTNFEEVFDLAVSNGFLTSEAAAGGVQHSLGFLAGVPIPLPTDIAVDLGSGGGLPGLVLAAKTSCRWYLVDRSERRCSFLEWAIGVLGLSGRTEVVHSDVVRAVRGELRSRANLVTARGFGSPGVTAECAVGFLAIDGKLVISEPPNEFETRWATGPLRKLGFVNFGSWRYEGSGFFAVRLVEEVSPGIPRSWRTITRSPMF